MSAGTVFPVQSSVYDIASKVRTHANASMTQFGKCLYTKTVIIALLNSFSSIMILLIYRCIGIPRMRQFWAQVVQTEDSVFGISAGLEMNR